MRKSRIKAVINNAPSPDITGLNRFRREEHLKGKTRIREVFDKGRQVSAGQRERTIVRLKLFIMENDLQYNRICFTCAGGRKFGNAVQRNRAKRLGREAYRLIKGSSKFQFKYGYDLILLIYPGVNKLSCMMEQMRFLFNKARLLTSM